MLFVPLSVGGALLIAVALNRPLRFIRLYRTAVFVPVVASTIATSIIFLQLFDPNFGLINWALGTVGLGPYGFLQDPDQALYAIVILTVWGWIGFDVIVFLAALQGVPRELIEAAMIDGATPFGAFRRVVVPLLGPATLFLVVWSTINALQLFDEIYFLTKGGPLFSTYVLVYYVFDLAFQKGLAGYAAAVAYTLFAAILVLTAIQLGDRAADGALLVMSAASTSPAAGAEVALAAAVQPVAPRAGADRAGDGDAARCGCS